MHWRAGNYTSEEVRAVLEEWEELNAIRYKQWVHVRLLDVGRAVRRLSRPHMEAVILCGLAGLTTRTAGKLVETSHMTMHRRYIRGIEEIVSYLNGGKHQ